MSSKKLRIQFGPSVFLFGIVILVIVLLIWLSMASCEASTFNNITGHDVSTWQALWVDLQVVGEPK